MIEIEIYKIIGIINFCIIDLTSLGKLQLPEKKINCYIKCKFYINLILFKYQKYFQNDIFGSYEFRSGIPWLLKD